jgi:hypothetical protein
MFPAMMAEWHSVNWSLLRNGRIFDDGYKIEE